MIDIVVARKYITTSIVSVKCKPAGSLPATLVDSNPMSEMRLYMGNLSVLPKATTFLISVIVLITSTHSSAIFGQQQSSSPELTTDSVNTQKVQISGAT